MTETPVVDIRKATALAIMNWPVAGIYAHIKRCIADPSKNALNLWTVEAEWPPSALAPDMKPRVGRVYCEIYFEGRWYAFAPTNEFARRVLTTLVLCGAENIKWVTAYDDPPDDDSPGVEYKGSNGETIVKAPCYAGRLWTLGDDRRDVDVEEEIPDWSSNDCGSCYYLTDKASPITLVI